MMLRNQIALSFTSERSAKESPNEKRIQKNNRQ